MFKSVPVGLAALTFLSEGVMASKAEYRPSSEQAPWYKAAKGSTWNTPDWPVNYKVPNFGVDNEILTNNKNLADAETKLKTKLTAVKKAADASYACARAQGRRSAVNVLRVLLLLLLPLLR